jgi:glycosyltransferase involved in cell wall biosynthesis
VAEPTGGTEEIVVDGESGLLGRGSDELGRALRRVLDDPSLTERLREGRDVGPMPFSPKRSCFLESSPLPKRRRDMKVALLSRAVFPIHGYGGLERTWRLSRNISVSKDAT